MTGLKMREIRDMGSEEMAGKLAELKEELAKQHGQIASGTRPDNTGRVRAVRKAIARILTLQRERELTQQKNKKNQGV